jgi:hypothetical protein
MASDIDDEEKVDVEASEELAGFNVDILDMSDDELMDMTNEQIAEASMKAEAGASSKEGASAESKEEEEEEEDKDEKDEDDKGEEEEEDDKSESDNDADDDKSDEDDADKKKAESDKDSKGDDADASESDDKAKATKEAKAADPKDKSIGEVDYKQEYEKLLAPFKANGRQIQVDNVDDALTLMKMGANYNKKMAALKPSLKVVKMLEQNGLLDEEKINHLIDLSNHDAGAVAKLLKDAKMDPLDIDASTDADYKPKDHKVNDSQWELDQVLEDLKDNESFPKTIDVISNQWDEKSKKLALNDPRIISVIDEQIQSGVYDQIVAVMDRERMVGRLTDIPDLEAYMQIGQDLTAKGTLVTQKKPDTLKPTEEDEKKDLETAAARKLKREAAASTKKGADKQKQTDFNPLEMSDAEFEKHTADGLFR